MKQLLTIFVLHLLVFTLAAQHYEPLKCSGRIPIDFTMSPIKKYERLIEEIPEQARKSGRETEEQFFLESSFIIDELLKSGKVLYNDPVTNYINQVADSLLVNYPDLRKQVKFYAVRSTSVNAFATHEGIIFVNLGLIARLETEAQLAFVLAHEIIHFKESHALNIYANEVRNNEVKAMGFTKNKVLEEHLFSKQNFSKDLEIQADEKGLLLFKSSNYSLNSIPRLFDILSLSHLPFDNESVQRSFFETDYLKFPNHLFLAETRTVVPTGSHDEGASTHPGLNKRKNIIENYITSSSKLHWKGDFLTNRKLFYNLRKKTRYDLPYLYLNEGEFYNAIYTSYLLLSKGENSQHLELCIAKGLQGFTYYRNYKLAKRVQVHHNYVQGEVQQLYHFLNNLKNSELNVLAFTYAWEKHKQYPKNEAFQEIAAGLCQELVNFHYSSLDQFYQTAPKSTSMTSNSDVAAGIDSNWKNEFAQYAFVEYLKDVEFVSMFRECKKQKHFAVQQNNYQENQSLSYKKAQHRLELEKGKALGIDKIVLVNPHYVRYDTRKLESNQKLYVESEDARKDFRKKLWKNAQLVDLQTTILDMKQLNTTDCNKYNDIVVINEWFDQQMDFEYFEMSSFNQEQANQIAEKYNTNYFVWMGVIDKREKKDFVSSLSDFFNPYNGLYSLITPKYESLFFAVVYDVKNYELKMVKMDLIKQKDNDAIINAHIYDTFLQIKKK